LNHAAVIRFAPLCSRRRGASRRNKLNDDSGHHTQEFEHYERRQEEPNVDDPGALHRQPPDGRDQGYAGPIGKLNGMSEQEVEAWGKDQALLDKIAADQRYALETLKVESTPTFFVNGKRLKDAMSFEQLDEKLKPHLNR